MRPFHSTIISVTMLVFGLVAVLSMMIQQGRKGEGRAGLVTWHKISGYAFFGLFVLMFVSMIWRVEEYWEESSARIALHVALSIAALFLVSLKVVIPRFFPKMWGHLFGLGVFTYALTFSLVLNTAGYYLIWRAHDQPYIYNDDTSAPSMLSLDLGRNFFITKCSTCHILDKLMTPRGPKDWKTVINKMVKLGIGGGIGGHNTQLPNLLFFHPFSLLNPILPTGPGVRGK